MEGWPTKHSLPSIDTVVAYFVHSNVSRHSEVNFKPPGNSMATAMSMQLATLQTAIEYTQLSNIYSIPTDCPQREKRGWVTN